PQPSCVECLPNSAAEDCDDGNVCTTESCAGGACVRTNNSSACTAPGGGAGICVAGGCVPRICTPDTTSCSGSLLQQCNANGTALTTLEDCGSAGLCSPGGCGTPCDPTQCEFGCNAQQTACNPCDPAQCNGTDPATCALRQCS